YFSSDVHPGMGKLDIFSSRFDGAKWTTIKNLKPPINSIGDDFSFIITDENDMGFFSSDRFNGKGAEDIYGFIEMKPMTLSINGELFEFKDNSLLDGITYKLITNETNEENALASQNGKYSFSIPEGKTFTLSSRKEGFSYNKVDLTLKRNTENAYIRATISPKQRGISVNGILLEDSISKDSIPEIKQIPLTGITISILDSTATIGSSKTDNNGYFSFSKKLLPGKKYLIVAGKKINTVTQESKTETTNKEPVKQITSDTLNKVRVTATVICKKVIMPNVKISINDSLGRVCQITSNANGEYNLSIMAEHKYYFSVSEKGYLPKEIEVIADRSTKQMSRDIVLSEIKIDAVIKLNNVYYDYNSAVIQNTSLAALNILVDFMEDNPAISIELSSHTDSRGDDAYNLKLSQARAQMVKDYLTLFDIDSFRIIAKGYGETKPIMSNAQTEAEHQQNRRKEFKIVSK
ncbi:MAG: OmpA family protein, partial [Bacteroidota bacterium]